MKASPAIIPQYRTQKAVGLKALRDNSFQTPAFDVFGVEHFAPVSPYDTPLYTEEVRKMQSQLQEMKNLRAVSIGDAGYYLDNAISALSYQLQQKESQGLIGTQLGFFPERQNLGRFVNKFVRPCPMVPRHGFVDSRPVNSIKDAEKLLEETLKAEDKAEFIVMPFIKASYSGIWTNGKLVIGSGNDGATAGHSSRLIPALGVPSYDNYLWDKTLKEARITESPYVELLWSKKYEYDTDYINYFVQLRNGPSLPDSIDYIPEEVEITNIVIAEGDLLEWETKAQKFTRGTCVYHPGGSLASHYAVHAVLAKTPVLISREPQVGEKLVPNTETKEPNLEAIRNGFYLGATTKMDFQKAAFAMLVGCHSTSVWLGKQDMLLGFAMGCAYRLTITATLGEYRHEPGRKRKPKRASVYKGVWDKILASSTRTRYMKALDSFQNKKWPGSFGGKAWYNFGSYAAAMYNSLLDGDITGSLQNLNKCVNAAHNSGWAFDKFVHKSVMDKAAKNPSLILLDVAPELYEVILVSERDQTLGEWFKGKHHVEVEPMDEEKAKRDERREMASGSELNTLHDPEQELDSSGGYDCGDPRCSLCNPYGVKQKKEKKPKKIISAQVKKNFRGKPTVYYKTENDRRDYNVQKFKQGEKEKFGKIFDAIVKSGKTESNYMKESMVMVPLTLVGNYAYLHFGADDPTHSWSDCWSQDSKDPKKGYVYFPLASKDNSYSIHGFKGLIDRE
jgi:hypothetical protein